MNILIIGQPRSRSHFVLHSLADFYGLENLMEPYKGIEDGPDYLTNIEQVTRELLTKQNFVCKLQTSDISGWQPAYNCFRFEMYDSVYITARKNITEQVASLLVARTYDSWGHYPANPLAITFDSTKHMFLLEEIKQDNKKLNICKKQLIENNIYVKTLYYEISENWVKTHLENATTELEKSNYDYKKIISNYSELEELVSHHFDELDII